MVGKAERLQRFHQAFVLRVLWSKAVALSGDELAATKILAEVLPLALREGYRRIFLDEGEVIVRLLRKSDYKKLVMEPLAAARQPKTPSQQWNSSGGSPNAAQFYATKGLEVRERFSDREIQVLHLVAHGLSNRTIAERLFISEATVKFHLHNINLKTGAHSRTQAIAIARRLGLIE